MNKVKITIVGAGYVGMSLAVLLAKHHEIKVLDIDKEKVQMINAKKSPLADKDIKEAFKKEDLNLFATADSLDAFVEADYIIIATPTHFEEDTNSFDSTSVETVIDIAMKENKKALIVIKSTVGIGFTESQASKHKTERIIFSPEFLREWKALHDNLNPSRLVIGGSENKLTISFSDIMKEAAINKEFDTLFMSYREAESVKLFSNTYLAMRVAFFNELDSFSMQNDMDSLNIIHGVSSDSRIGNYYNNPSFGYGGYCLPKDTKQLLADFKDTPQSLIKSIIESNEIRKQFISKKIQDIKANTIGIYRLIMKDGSDNFRASSVLSIIDSLKENGLEIVIYEPIINSSSYQEIPVIKELNSFIRTADIIIANRFTDELSEVKHKTFTRDIFNSDL
ncbi:MAG: nucleotide sugar dehydrogenase [Pseudomonadota bacterium]|nr:nucleotide sugar dehydrogenase [Pseudomonadota bacterium]